MRLRKPTARKLTRFLKRITRRITTLLVGDEYVYWRWCYARIGRAERKAIHRTIAKLASYPKFRVLTIADPQHITNPRSLLNGLTRQPYPHWNFSLVLRGEPRRGHLLDTVSTDPRVDVTMADAENLSALLHEMVHDCNDELLVLLPYNAKPARHALFRIAQYLNEFPDSNLIYSDHDHQLPDGRCCVPVFKPDWNPDLFLQTNYVGNFFAVRLTALRKMNTLPTNSEGFDTFDLLLRLADQLHDRTIGHIPEVLVHYQVADKTIAHRSEVTLPNQARLRDTLRDYFIRTGVPATVQPPSVPTAFASIRYALPLPAPTVSIIIPTRNATPILKTCIESILAKTDYPAYELVIVDNDSDDPSTLGYLDKIATYPNIKVLRYPFPFNYSAINNFAVSQASGDFVCLLNNDTEVINAEWLGEMVALGARPGTGAVGAKLFYPDGTLQHCGVILGVRGIASHAFKFMPEFSSGYMGRADLIQNFSAVTAACLLVKTELYRAIGGLNESDLPVAFNDVDFCLRLMQAGYWNVWTPHAKLYHHESKTRGADTSPEKKIRAEKEHAYMRLHWSELIANDPAYNPNLTDREESFALAWPPRRPIRSVWQ